MTPQRLAAVMAHLYARAAEDLGETPLTELYERFVAWSKIQ